MPGMMKKKHYSETMEYMKSFTGPLNCIAEILPFNYGKKTILDFFIRFYPYEWNRLEERYKYYYEKDLFLEKIGKKIRYNHPNPELFFYSLSKVKYLVSSQKINNHKMYFDSEKHKLNFNLLELKRKNKISAYTNKTGKAKENLQNVDPLYIDIFIAAYHKKGSATEDKIEIFNEIKKFYSDKIITFLQKINDSEHNNQIRRMAFEHLQNIGVYVKLRKNFKGNKKSYMFEKDDFNVSPKDLVERIESDSIQNNKTFHIFISHSYSDSNVVRKIKDELNRHNLTVYCDWTSDNDFLRRNVASEYTRIVLKKRIKQSNAILFLQTKNSSSYNGDYLSEWVEMEINHAIELSKPIFCINTDDTSPIFKSIPFTIINEKLTISPVDIELIGDFNI